MSNAKKRTVKSKSEKDPEDKKEDVINLRYGPMPAFPQQKQYARIIIAISLVVIVYFYGKKTKENVFAVNSTVYAQRTAFGPCSESFKIEISKFQDCVPRRCGRGVYDNIVNQQEVEALRRIAESGLSLGSASGSASILDLHSGAVSHGENFISVYKVADFWKVIRPADFAIYKIIRTKIQHTIAAQFLVNPLSIRLTHPTFFSNLTSAPPKTIHDEYWHPHVDKETYESFHYTALVYLSNYGSDFEGGRFLFIETDNSTSVIEPRRGRVSVFTSGAENPHKVERVTRGSRLALTIAFTCDKTLGINDPSLPTDKV